MWVKRIIEALEEIQHIPCVHLILLKYSGHVSIKKLSDRWILLLFCDFFFFWFVLWGIVMKMILAEELQVTSSIIFTDSRNTLLYCRFYSVSVRALKFSVIHCDFCSFQYSSSEFFYKRVSPPFPQHQRIGVANHLKIDFRSETCYQE